MGALRRPGGENERWTLVRETRNPRLQPDGSGHIDIAQEWSSKEAALFTHPADDCCPVTTVGLDELRGGAGGGAGAGCSV